MIFKAFITSAQYNLLITGLLDLFLESPIELSQYINTTNNINQDYYYL